MGQLLYVCRCLSSLLCFVSLTLLVVDFDTQGAGDGVVVMYNEGDSCTGTSRAKISMLFHCNNTVATTQLTSVVAIGMYCHWVAHFESPLGCQITI